MPKLNRIPIEDATLVQLRDYVDLENLDVTASDKSTKARLVAKIEQAGLGGKIVVVEEDEPSHSAFPGRTNDIWDDDLEKWCRIRIALDILGKKRDTPVWLSCNGVAITVPRNRNVHIKGRYMEVLQHSVSSRPSQQFDSDGVAKDTPETAERVTVEQYSYSFLGYTGYVNDGHPKYVEEGDIVIGGEPGAPGSPN